jgi:hypothetical protein
VEVAGARSVPSRELDLNEPVRHSVEFAMLLPTQHAERNRRRHDWEGARRLCAAVLADAVNLYLKSGQGKRFREARAWIESTDRTRVFSFERVCEVLGMDPGYLRRGLQRRHA